MIDKIINALKKAYMYQINCELTPEQCQILLDYIGALTAKPDKQTEMATLIDVLNKVRNQKGPG